MTPVSAFRTRIAGRVAGIPDMTIDLAVLDTAIDFCMRSLIVKGSVAAFPTILNQREYSVVDTGGRLVCHIQRAWCNVDEMTPMDEDVINAPFQFSSSIPGQTTPTGMPGFFTETAPAVIALYPIPDAVYTINARCAFAPARTATQVDDVLASDWTDGIVHGALSRLYMQPGEASNPNLAKFHGIQYEAAVNAAMVKARRGQTRAQSRVQPVHI